MPQDNLEEISVPIASHNVGVRQLDPSPKHWASTPQRTDDGVCSEIPSHFDLRAARDAEVETRPVEIELDTKTPRTESS